MHSAAVSNWTRSRGEPLPHLRLSPRFFSRPSFLLPYPYASYFENRMITRLRSRFPATCSRFGGVEGEYILSVERESGGGTIRRRATWPFSRERARRQGRERKVQGRRRIGGAPLLYRKVAWGVDARIHMHIHMRERSSRRSRTTICVERSFGSV